MCRRNNATKPTDPEAVQGAAATATVEAGAATQTRRCGGKAAWAEGGHHHHHHHGGWWWAQRRGGAGCGRMKNGEVSCYTSLHEGLPLRPIRYP